MSLPLENNKKSPIRPKSQKNNEKVSYNPNPNTINCNMKTRIVLDQRLITSFIKSIIIVYCVIVVFSVVRCRHLLLLPSYHIYNELYPATSLRAHGAVEQESRSSTTFARTDQSIQGGWEPCVAPIIPRPDFCKSTTFSMFWSSRRTSSYVYSAPETLLRA